jgi:hypothetical protein
LRRQGHLFSLTVKPQSSADKIPAFHPRPEGQGEFPAEFV